MKTNPNVKTNEKTKRVKINLNQKYQTLTLSLISI